MGPWIANVTKPDFAFKIRFKNSISGLKFDDDLCAGFLLLLFVHEKKNNPTAKTSLFKGVPLFLYFKHITHSNEKWNWFLLLKELKENAETFTFFYLSDFLSQSFISSRFGGSSIKYHSNYFLRIYFLIIFLTRFHISTTCGQISAL